MKIDDQTFETILANRDARAKDIAVEAQEIDRREARGNWTAIAICMLVVSLLCAALYIGVSEYADVAGTTASRPENMGWGAGPAG